MEVKFFSNLSEKVAVRVTNKFEWNFYLISIQLIKTWRPVWVTSEFSEIWDFKKLVEAILLMGLDVTRDCR